MERNKVPILMYHSIQNVSKTEPMRSLHVSPAAFKKQLQILKILGFRGCTVSEAVNALREGSKEKIVALTFDDGYQNFLSNALPALQKFGFKATVYVLSGLIGKTNIWDRASGISPNSLLNKQELKLCIRSGVELGCHSHNHHSLISEDVSLANEITESKHLLEQQFEVDVHSFCYPYGHFNTRVLEAVQHAGFKSATTMIRSRASYSDDSFMLPRIPVNWHTLPHLFVAKILTKYEDRRRDV